MDHTRRRGAEHIDIVAPNGSDGYLRVANTDEPAEHVVQDTERIEAAVQEEHPGYQRIRLEPTDYRDTEAAIWEYTFTADGQTYHAMHLNMSTGERGYALNHVVPEEGLGRGRGALRPVHELVRLPVGVTGRADGGRAMGQQTPHPQHVSPT